MKKNFKWMRPSVDKIRPFKKATKANGKLAKKTQIQLLAVALARTNF